MTTPGQIPVTPLQGGAMLAGILATQYVASPIPPIPPPIITAWMLELPFTNAIDLVNDINYPLPYRVGGASVAKLIITQTTIHYGGTYIGNAWMLSMVQRQMVETPGFAQIYNAAPIISGTDISGEE
jgi:hypothetical protein